MINTFNWSQIIILRLYIYIIITKILLGKLLRTSMNGLERHRNPENRKHFAKRP